MTQREGPPHPGPLPPQAGGEGVEQPLCAPAGGRGRGPGAIAPSRREQSSRLSGGASSMRQTGVRWGDAVSEAPTPAEALAGARRLIVKIGSALLVAESGEIRRAWLDGLADDVARCRGRGQEVILVSSGAIAVGRRHLGLAGRRLRLEEQQAAAATGQIRLAHAYQEALARHGITVAQILLTLDDTEERRRHLNARATFAQLLALGAVPVVNENDTVATAEIRFGDNDRLAARVAQMTSADMLVLLSDIDGLYTADPRKNADARHVPTVREIGPEIEAMAGEAAPGYSSGGMVTKLAAARIAMNAGCYMLIARGVPKGGAPPAPSTRLAWLSSTMGPLGRCVGAAACCRPASSLSKASSSAATQ